MATLFDMMMEAQNGRAMELVARQFELSRQQAEFAVEALMPAFSQGLKRSASDPYGIAAFMTALASGQHAKYFEDVQKAFSPEGIVQGNAILANLFGSKELSRAIAAQAAQATGIAQEIFKQMLPVVAAMMMGGLFKQATKPQSDAGTPSNPLGEMMAEMMRRGAAMMGASSPQAEQPRFDPFDNPFSRAMQDMFGGAARQTSGPSAASKEAPASGFENPWMRVFADMMRGQPTDSSAQEQAATQKSGPKRQHNPYDDLFGQMFKAGRNMQNEYQKNVEAIFEQFSKGFNQGKS
ncbi:DUF937 domain-containing protein [Pseudaminobacter sp. 19-2017]|uniref:DUF937 domain-containing protein n=1 Tax=Pseudaminobacter soli (ex Zhang et al. 2022) TaxID=2831468 RepID=A0A942E0M8_9HYPH|nr:DUF937 domain-containing protein [Pseudaminobacter soli]MBS3648435.1 DUF937 domain-containing protein [Pseudaminobacter soli]